MRDLILRDLSGVVDSLFSFDLPRPTISPIKIDVKEDSQKFTLHADVPGVEKENIKVKFNDGHLTLDVEVVQEQKNENERLIRMERHSAHKSRTIFFGDNINSEGIKAQYKNGVLTLELPKKAPVHVEVKDISVE